MPELHWRLGYPFVLGVIVVLCGRALLALPALGLALIVKGSRRGSLDEQEVVPCMRESGGRRWWLRSWRSAAAGSGATAQADGPGVGTPAIVALGDSAISGEAGRWAGNTNNSSSRVDALGSTAYYDDAGGRGDPRLPPLQVGRGAHRRRRPEREPRVLGRAHVDERGRQRLQARHRLLLGRVRAQGPGARAAAVRGDAQRARRRAADRRQQLRLRRHRAGVRDRLADLAVVVAELLQRRLGHQVALHGRARSRPRPRTCAARSSTSARRWPTPATRTRQYTILVADLLVADPARLRLPLPAVGLHAPDDRRLRRLEPRRRLGQRHRRAARSTTRSATPAAQSRAGNVRRSST